MTKPMQLDIHDYATKAIAAERQIRGSDLSARNKELILGFRDACLVRNVCGRVRLIRVLGVLLLVGRHAGRDFDQLTKEDVERIITALLMRQPPYTAETLSTYKRIIKNFLTWVFAPDRFPTTTNLPAQVSWITCTVRKRDKKRLERKDLLTPEDIQALLDACLNPRDKALISILWETGCRVAEIGNLQLKHVTKNAHGYTLDLTGKTGHRNPMIISSAPYLTVWLNSHPFRNDPESPLWVFYQHRATPQHVKYATIRHLLARTFQRAKITKPFHPHLFRHSRATYVLATGLMNEAQAKAYFGWSADTDMLATYSHLVDQDANNAILRENNLAPLKQEERELRPTECRICNELNPPRTEYCTKCGAVLDLKAAYEHQRVHQLKDDLFVNLFRLLVQKGLVDEAAKEVHDAGLGPTLKCLAQHVSGEQPLSALPIGPPSATTRTAPKVEPG